MTRSIEIRLLERVMGNAVARVEGWIFGMRWYRLEFCGLLRV